MLIAAAIETLNLTHINLYVVLTLFQIGFTLSQVTKAVRESRGIAVLYFRPLH